MNMKFSLLLACMGLVVSTFGQVEPPAPDTSWQDDYRHSSTRINDLVNTRLDIRFDYDKSYAYGKVWITLKPHFYPTDSLELDAKGMDIKKVALVQGSTMKPLKYDYDGLKLNIKLNKTYKNSESYVVYVDYTSKPYEYNAKGSAAITDARGLYFINPKGEEKDKPTQIWTQGETEATSVWVPTIDKPNQKTTDEISMTVPAKYVTLSNGKLVSQKKNSDGTRTDTWKMDLPHAPYLFFMGVGDYAIIKDKYKDKEVNYYVEKEYAPVARRIFGHTPEMIAFYSRILGVDYPWVKYSQITGRDYVSGAMENTTATLHGESAQQDARELVDGNGWESTIAHELFHQWFGDLVTTESWSNITLNESFANYSETLWDEYKYGQDAGDAQNYSDMRGYLQSGSGDKDLVRYYYKDKEDVFDAVSYNKGGRILHMLRNYVGDSAFFKSLNLYLTTNKFKSAEAAQLRLAFEEITGRDLHWFWNQWYYGSGHPKLSIDYVYDDQAGTVKVIVKQTQSEQLFKLPIAIDVYEGAKKTRYPVWLEHAVDSFTLPYKQHPDLVNVDGDKILLAEKKDNKTMANYAHQYKYAGRYLDRREAIEFAAKHQTSDPQALALLKEALADKYYGLRGLTLQSLNLKNATVKSAVESEIANMARKEPKSTVRATAIADLAEYDKPDYASIFEQSLNDSSYTVAGEALNALAKANPDKATAAAKKLSQQPAKGELLVAIAKTLIASKDESAFDLVADAYGKLPLSQAKFELTQPFCQLLASVSNTQKVKSGVDMIVKFRNGIPEQYGITPIINNMLKGVISKKEAAKAIAENKQDLQEQIDYIKGAIEEKKAF